MSGVRRGVVWRGAELRGGVGQGLPRVGLVGCLLARRLSRRLVAQALLSLSPTPRRAVGGHATATIAAAALAGSSLRL